MQRELWQLGLTFAERNKSLTSEGTEKDVYGLKIWKMLDHGKGLVSDYEHVSDPFLA